MEPINGIKVTVNLTKGEPLTSLKSESSAGAEVVQDGFKPGEQVSLPQKISLQEVRGKTAPGSAISPSELAQILITTTITFPLGPLTPAMVNAHTLVSAPPGPGGDVEAKGVRGGDEKRDESLSTALPSTGVPASDQPGMTYQKASTVDEVRRYSAHLKDTAMSMLHHDCAQVLGDCPGSIADRFMIDADSTPELRQRLMDAYELAPRLLEGLSNKVLSAVERGKYHLHCDRVSIKHLGDATEQHVGYSAGVLNRLEGLSQNPKHELSRLLLRRYFDGKLEDTSGAKIEARALLADELSKAAGNDQKVADFVMAKENDGLFSPEAATNDPALLSNLASHWAGDATMQFTAKLLGSDDRKASAFLKQLFRRPNADLQQMTRDPNGMEGLVLHFAATAHHQAWEWAKLGSAAVLAASGEGSAVDKWNHKDIMETRQLMAERVDSARKVSDQIESYMLREGLLIPCQWEGDMGEIPLSRLLEIVESKGIFTDDSGLRVVSPFAAQVKEQLFEEVKQAARVSDWHVGAHLAADVVANTCAAYASHATKADYEGREALIELYRNAIGKFSPQVDALLADGIPSAKDDAYQALYQEMAGEFGLEALKEHMGVGKAYDLVNNATIENIIPAACEALRLPMRPGYTAANLVKDMEEMKGTILKDDYFLGKNDFMEELRAEATRPAGEVNPSDLENGIRIPNAVWMWTQLLRGLVEKKEGRYTGQDADMSSDKFPSGVQLSPPDMRDVELFTWARHRLEVGGCKPGDAARKALAVVVLTQYKDLLQLRKAA